MIANCVIGVLPLRFFGEGGGGETTPSVRGSTGLSPPHGDAGVIKRGGLESHVSTVDRSGLREHRAVSHRPFALTPHLRAVFLCESDFHGVRKLRSFGREIWSG